VRSRGNVQKVAADLSIAYNTARNRLDGIVAALGEPLDREEEVRERRITVLQRLSVGELEFDEALRLLEE
jgi:hypothetical protein